MDNTAQNNTNDDVQAQTQPQQSSQTTVAQTPLVSPQPTPVPIGSMNKEAELAPVSDFVKPTETPAVKDKEVAEAGVKEVLQTPELNKEHERIGIKPSAEATPVKVEIQDENDRLPMTQIQAGQIAKKNKDIKSSIVWLAILMLKNFKKAHRRLLGKGV